MTTFTEVTKVQCDAMMGAAKRLDEKGYLLAFFNYYDPRYHARQKNPKLPYDAINKVLWAMFQTWRKEHGRRVISILVWPDGGTDRTKMAGPFDCDFLFEVVVPRTTRLRIITTALGFILPKQDKSSGFTFKGRGKVALQNVIKILDMPDHREMLVTNRKV